ncbi:mediator of RNA polymerase II transcription subunit 13-like isoform X1 [Diorhabda sublineata]|uniref:mediator of RNA polymerase II transcription subunit 13-like isoform X1 n=1 Tax=Diorhabda sublineata TaxID=1163346 RepID=UPI0024E0E336|nr:mediator of RNA polymerase II transcription subunit 13-like isoform X1 [Diorhabda sublineata]
MTHPNFQTNGASLEDCHTNFFALTELSGIKWRKLVWSEADRNGGGGGGGGVGHHGPPPGGGNTGTEPLEDPVLRSYARCLAADILCVWRRVSTSRAADMFDLGPPPSTQPPPLSLSASKELWIFWYGEEPDLNELVAPELNMNDCEQGSWESGLSYECRSLLFKALHNLIERCLLSRDFIRIGKWFVQPCGAPVKRSNDGINNGNNNNNTTSEGVSVGNAHLSFSFAFFVHGESSVCASVDVRQHPPVRRLSRWHVQQAQASTAGLKVVLAPFGLSGVLTGHSFKSPEATTRLLDDWSQFYPLDKSSTLTDSSVVEVIVGGVKMRYPSCYVLITDMDESANSAVLNGLPPTSPSAVVTTAVIEERTEKRGGSPVAMLQTPPPSPVNINSRVVQPGPYTVSVEHFYSMSRDATAATVLPERTWQECILGGGGQNAQQDKEFSGNWDFVEPTRRTNCICSKCRKSIAPTSSSNKWTSSSGASPRWSSGKTGRTKVPFHRRSPLLPLTNERCNSGSYTPQGGPPSYPRTQESTAIPSVGSPPSVAPSPLPNPHSQPASVPPGDQTMPTLSPHPPTANPSPLDKTHTPDLPLKSVDSSGNSPTTVTISETKNETQTNVINLPMLKRPLLISKEYEVSVALGEEEQTLEMLYDYSTMDAWLNHPVKKFKPDGKENQRLNRLGKQDIYSLYDKSYIINQTNEVVNNNNNKNQPMIVKQEIKQEPGQSVETDTALTTNSVPHGVKRPGDPYEFEEDGSGTNCNIDGFKRGQAVVVGGVKEENKEVKKITTTDNLFTSEGLQPSYKDLDQIFDNSDYTSSDEAMQIQTPPGSTTINHHEDNKRFSGGHGCPNVGIPCPAELSKMFPTPPSLEHNPIASPCGLTDIPLPEFSTDLGIVRVKQEIYPNMGSPPEENIEDWSFVFKPPPICKMVGSSKYAPLTNLPSQSLPPVSLPTNFTYKPSWVQHVEKQQTNQQTNNNNNVTTTSNNNQNTPATTLPNSVHQNTTLFPPSPLTNAGTPGSFRPPPPPYEMASPATSTASSYLNKNLNSVEAAPTPTPGIPQRTPEASSLVLNILLTDTAFNIFRDHNFDSCTLCVCNAAGKVVGNIRGADAGIYLLNTQSDKQHASAQPSSPYPGNSMGQPPPYGTMMNEDNHSNDEDSIRCSCGFSAVVNRRLAYGSGLFYEDEVEITGIAEDPGEKKKSSLLSFLVANNSIKLDPNIDRDQIDILPHSLIELVREQLVFIPNTTNSLCRVAGGCTRTKLNIRSNSNIHVLEYTDSHEVTCIALEQSKNFFESMGMCKMEDIKSSKNSQLVTVHRWPFLRATGPQCNQDIVRVMRNLQPLLQEAIQKKCQTRLWEAPSAVKGPLTWRQFHRLAGRGTDDRCEPQPIPSVIVGHDKDWLSLSPYALQHWETLLLEPYSYARDVAYIVVAPDNDTILPRVRTFFRELSTAYEMCKLGRHSPITKVLRDGILRVGKTAKTKIGNEPVEEWFTLLGEGETTDMLKLYAQVCKHHLAPHLQQVPMDKTLLDPPQENTTDQPTPSPMPPPSTPENASQSSVSTSSDKASTPKSDQDGEGSKDSSPIHNANDPVPHDDDEREVPSVIVYLVEPFTLGTDQPELQRLACLALLRCYQSVLAAVPENIRNNISVQIISLESIVELNKARNRNRHSDHMRALALNIFSQCRRLLIHTNNVKSLTGFGTAAMADQFLKSKDEKNRAPYKLYTPPYILAPMRGKQEPADAFSKGAQEQESVLYLSYCLSEDQSWLLAVATDEKGEIFETITINVDIPNRSRRKKASARRVGLEKLMNFILGVMSQSVRPWRLVVGRLGRIGHGELKGWSWLLSRKNLLKASKQLKEICNQCSMMYPNSVPCILSACLVSLEPDSVLRLMPDQFTPDERFSQVSVNSQLSTPQDVSCTHILVFPTSATTQSSQTAFQEQHITADLGDDGLFSPFDEDMPEGIDGMNDFHDIFNWTEIVPGGGQSPPGSPRREEGGAGSPNGGANVGREGTPMIGMNSKGIEPVEEVGVVLQQPLALGYFVSTAPTGKMPRWFWSSCPHLEGVCPAFLKNALHLHSPNIQQNSDDLFQQSSTVTSHPLDSQYTTDVLRYVLEGYNALSWLALDSNTKDRLSCLPVHMQVLVQLYNTAAALL